MSSKKIMIIAHFCDYGDEKANNRFNYLANLLSNSGYNVELVTSSFSHRDKKQRQKIENLKDSYKTTLIYEPSYQKNISLKRLFVSHRIMARNLEKYLEQCQKPDLIYCAIPSINVSEAAAKYSKEQKIPFVIDIQDLWPEAYKLILKNDYLYRLATRTMKKRIDKVYAAADQIIAVSDTYTRRAKEVNRKCDTPLTVYLGTEAEIFDNNVRNNIPLYKKGEDEFWIGYCGTLGHSYDLIVVMQALERLRSEGINNVRLIIIGSGPLEKQFKEKANELGILCTFTGKLSYELMCSQLCECDIAVNPIAKGAVQSIINKHADYAMAGLPIVSTQENREYKSFLETYKCGINCEPDSVGEVAEAIKCIYNDVSLRTYMGQMSRRLADERFDRNETYKSILRMIQGFV